MEVNRALIKFVIDSSPVNPSFMFVKKEYFYIGNNSILWRCSLASIDDMFGTPTDWNKYKKVYLIDKLSLDNILSKNIDVIDLIEKCSTKNKKDLYTRNGNDVIKESIKIYDIKFTGTKELVMSKLIENIQWKKYCKIEDQYVNCEVLNNVMRHCKLNDVFPYNFDGKEHIIKIGNFLIPTVFINESQISQSGNDTNSEKKMTVSINNEDFNASNNE